MYQPPGVFPPWGSMTHCSLPMALVDPDAAGQARCRLLAEFLAGPTVELVRRDTSRAVAQHCLSSADQLRVHTGDRSARENAEQRPGDHERSERERALAASLAGHDHDHPHDCTEQEA